VASTCSVGEVRFGEEGSDPDLAGDDSGAVTAADTENEPNKKIYI